MASYPNYHRVWAKVTDWIWALLVILLPITSMPLIVQIVRSSSVAAPAGLALSILLLLWLIPYLLKGGALPLQVIPLLGFALVATLSTIIASLSPIPPFKNINHLIQGIQALITVAIGISFYLVAATINSDLRKMEWTFRLINWSGLIVLIWSFLQVVTWVIFQDHPGWMNNIQGILSTADLYRYQQRATAFTSEPSWLAHQLNMLYLPLWLASTVCRYSAHRFRIIRLTFENLLVAGGIIVLGLTLSRAGLIAFLIMLAYPVMKLNLWIKSKLQSRLAHRWSVNNDDNWGRKKHFYLSAGLLIIMVIIYLGLLIGMVYGLSHIDPRMQSVFNFDISQDNVILRYGSELRVESRIVYWIAGWNVFNDYPWLGVGLGNSGFFFPQKIIPFGWNFMEVRDVMFRTNDITNVKSLWIRLLSETGVIGLAFFLSWWLMLWKSARMLEKNGYGLPRMLGLSGIFVLLALVIEGFSIDSFALPYFWLSLGLVSIVSTKQFIITTSGSRKKSKNISNKRKEYE